MLTSAFDYDLPQSLIAQHPIRPRDHSRLMVADRKKRTVNHCHFYDVVDYLKQGDLLVWNNSKVFKARLFGRLEPVDKQVILKSENLKSQSQFSGKKGPSAPLRSAQGKIEIFLVREMENEGVWKVLAKPGRHVREGIRVRFSPSTGSGQAPDFYCDAMIKEKDGTILVQFPDNAETVRQKANKYGHVPVPPYIKEQGIRNKEQLLEQYQTIYAKYEGSVAAPTAGFHFTQELIKKLGDKGVEFAEITLHVGLGTFLPVKSERVEDHTMHSEWVELSEENAEKINRAKAEGRRVVAVGTTTVRTLEGINRFQQPDFRLLKKDVEVRLRPELSLSMSLRAEGRPRESPKSEVRSYKGDINLFITPGFEFKVVDAMITNFHLPKSTLLMLMCAFAGDTKFMLQCYQEAVEEKYGFYSFGDAMLIV